VDFTSLAKELMILRTKIDHLPEWELLSDLSGGEYFALGILSDATEALCPSGLSRAMGVSHARVSALLGSMEKKALIERRSDPGDERRVIVVLTEKGIERIRKKREETAARIAHILERIGSEGAEEYVALQKLIISASEDGGEG